MRTPLTNVLLAALLLTAGACQTDFAPTTTTSQAPSLEEGGRIPVANEEGEPVGYVLESDVEALESEGGGGQVPVYDEDTDDLVGHFKIGPGGGYQPLTE